MGAKTSKSACYRSETASRLSVGKYDMMQEYAYERNAVDYVSDETVLSWSEGGVRESVSRQGEPHFREERILACLLEIRETSTNFRSHLSTSHPYPILYNGELDG